MSCVIFLIVLYKIYRFLRTATVPVDIGSSARKPIDENIIQNAMHDAANQKIGTIFHIFVQK